MVTKIAMVLLLFPFSTHLFGWWDVPHMLISQIAKNQLDVSTIEKVEDLLAYFENDFPGNSTFVTASCFPDDITPLGLSGFKVWHGVLTPYSVNNFLTDREVACIQSLINDNNLHAAIRQSIKTLKNPQANTWEKSFLLRFLLHCVGDIHQPMHCIQLYSSQFPFGDLAGHRFVISGAPYKNLHVLWDAAFGIGAKKMVRPLAPADEQWIYETARSIEEMFPQTVLPECENMDYLQWSDESYDLAIRVAYNGIQLGGPPSDEYLAIGKHTALRQIALSGYRLARLIDEIFNASAQAQELIVDDAKISRG